MPIDPSKTLYYKRARFTTRLPTDRMYDRAHFWMLEMEQGMYRVGFTKFATRMLGDLVELNYDVASGESVSLGQVIGSIEGFKAISDLYCIFDGIIEDRNGNLESDSTLLDRDPYDQGWLYTIRGVPTETALDVNGYALLLDSTVDRMLDVPSETSEKKC